MSRAFVREQDADYLEDLPERPVSEHRNDVTEAGLAQIEAALAAASEAYSQARTAGDREALAAAGRPVLRGPRQALANAQSESFACKEEHARERIDESAQCGALSQARG